MSSVAFGCAWALALAISAGGGEGGAKPTGSEGGEKPVPSPGGPPKREPSRRAAPSAKPKKDGNEAKRSGSVAGALLEKVQRYYDATRDFSADFTQVYTRVALSRTSESSGRVMIKKPGMMRWEYQKPATKLFVADGSQLFIYEPDEEQVIIDPHFKTTELSTSISFLWGEGKLSDSFAAAVGVPERYEAPKESNVLELVPKKDATYARLILILDAKTSQVLESILYETSGNTNRFKFKNTRINKELKGDLFKFTPPPGVEIIKRP